MQIDLPLDIFRYPDVALPQVWTVEQRFETPALTEIEVVDACQAAVKRLAEDPRIRPGARVAIGVGSRGLDNLVLVVRTVVEAVRAMGAEPFIVPAMGSHGGATREGQLEVLESYGITRESVGAEIQATMEVDLIGTLAGDDAGPYADHQVFYDRIAHGADAVLLINRIKAHTDFTGPLESGIGKMCAIGLGKRHGASGIHVHGAEGLRNLMPRVARFLAANVNIVGGVALIENELGRTAEIHALKATEVAREPEEALLRRARATAPRLPFTEIDVLIIDEMGKNISGAGMDTHVIGRGTMPSIPEHTWGGPNVRIIAVLDVTAESHGNVTAVGLADLTTRRLIEKADWRVSLINMRTSGEGGVLRGRIPLIMETAEDCVRTGIGSCGKADPAAVRFVRIRSTADVRYVEISEALLSEARRSDSLTVSDSPHPLNLCCPAGQPT